MAVELSAHLVLFFMTAIMAVTFAWAKSIAPKVDMGIWVKAEERLLTPTDINRASLEELTAVPGVGLVSAQRILLFRQGRGAIIDIRELDGLASPVSQKQYGELAKRFY